MRSFFPKKLTLKIRKIKFWENDIRYEKKMNRQHETRDESVFL